MATTGPVLAAVRPALEGPQPLAVRGGVERVGALRRLAPCGFERGPVVGPLVHAVVGARQARVVPVAPPPLLRGHLALPAHGSALRRVFPLYGAAARL